MIQAPTSAPPRVGLVTARTIQNAPDGWENGLTFHPERCPVGGRFDPCGDATLSIDASGRTVEFDAFAVWAGEKCSTFGFREDRRARATRMLESVKYFEIEEEFWTGELSDAASFSNDHLADPTSDDVTGTGGALSPTNALACLEEYLAQTLKGQRGMIHATHQLVTLWAGLQLVRREGNLVLTALDTIVVPGAGYPGTGPQDQEIGGAQFAYATDEVSLLLGSVTVTGENGEEHDRETNTIEIRAWQPVGIVWPKCAHGVVRVDVPLCAVGGAS